MFLSKPGLFIYFVLFVIGMLFSNSVRADENYWSCNGPWGGSVLTIAANPLDPHVVFIGTVQNGIYKSTDGGMHWRPLDTRDMESCMRIIAFHPTCPDTMYAATANGMYRSADGGNSWLLLSAPLFREYRGFVIHPVFPNLLFADDMKSTDSGETWYRPSSWQYANREWITIDPLNPNIMYFASGIFEDGRGVWKSTDIGETWLPIQHDIVDDGYGTDITVNPVNDSILFLSSDATFGGIDCLWRSTNAGETWTAVTPQNLNYRDIRHTRISPYYQNNVFVCSSTDGVFKSSDGGDSWYSVNTGLRICMNACIEFPSVKTGILLGTFCDGIARSLDEGESWENCSTGINAAECLDLDIDPRDSTNIFVTACNGLFHSTNSGQNWEYVVTPITFHNGPNSAAFDKYIPGMLYLCDGGRGYGIQDTAGFYQSDNNGRTWNRVSTNLPWDKSYSNIAISYHGFDDRRIFVVGWNGAYYSDNGGFDWTPCIDTLPINHFFSNIEIAPSDPDVIAISVYPNRLFISHDRGLTWREIQPLPVGRGYENYYSVRFHPFTSDHLYLSGDGEGLFESLDNGANWTKIDRNLPVQDGIPFISGLCINPVNPLNMFITSAHLGVFQSHDGGHIWFPFNDGIDTSGGWGDNLSFQGSDTSSLILASSDRSVWTIKWDRTGIVDNPAPIPGSLSIYCYPNPFNSSTKICFELPRTGDISFAIYDVEGREIKRIPRDKMTAGANSFNWDGTNDEGERLSSGLYFALLKCANSEKSLKMILLK